MALQKWKLHAISPQTPRNDLPLPARGLGIINRPPVFTDGLLTDFLFYLATAGIAQ
jgi:hypothetical protein